MRTAPVDGVRSTLRNFRLRGLAERAKATPVLRTYDGDTKYQLGNFERLPLVKPFDQDKPWRFYLVSHNHKVFGVVG